MPPTCQRCGCADPETSICGECWALWYDCVDCTLSGRDGTVRYLFCAAHSARPAVVPDAASLGAAAGDDACAGHDRSQQDQAAHREPRPQPLPSSSDVGGGGEWTGADAHGGVPWFYGTADADAPFHPAPIASAVAALGTRLWLLGQRLGKHERKLREWSGYVLHVSKLVRESAESECS